MESKSRFLEHSSLGGNRARRSAASLEYRISGWVVGSFIEAQSHRSTAKINPVSSTPCSTGELASTRLLKAMRFHPELERRVRPHDTIAPLFYLQPQQRPALNRILRDARLNWRVFILLGAESG